MHLRLPRRSPHATARNDSNRDVANPPVNEFYKKQLIAPWAQSLVPETCRRTAMFASLVEDSVRRAKADFPLVPLCPVKKHGSGTGDRWHGGKGSRYTTSL